MQGRVGRYGSRLVKGDLADGFHRRESVLMKIRGVGGTAEKFAAPNVFGVPTGLGELPRAGGAVSNFRAGFRVGKRFRKAVRREAQFGPARYGFTEKEKTKKARTSPLRERPGFLVRFRLHRCFQRPAGCAYFLLTHGFLSSCWYPASFSIGYRVARFRAGLSCHAIATNPAD